MSVDRLSREIEEKIREELAKEWIEWETVEHMVKVLALLRGREMPYVSPQANTTWWPYPSCDNPHYITT